MQSSNRERAIDLGEQQEETESGESRRSPRGWLFLAAFAAGFAITGIEMALGRLLAPHFGSSLTVWAAIIASIIGALSVGYPLGGWLADRKPGPLLPLVALLVGINLSLLIVMWLMGDLKPDHKTIAEFRRRNKKALEKVLGEVSRCSA